MGTLPLQVSVAALATSLMMLHPIVDRIIRTNVDFSIPRWFPPTALFSIFVLSIVLSVSYPLPFSEVFEQF